ncbi:MAG: ABC transporter ATP-binding protein, partial [Acidobacteria bacterium]|nr:ABC transporter ATP-binding protein [Acidobacteriota bacterium]
MTTRRSAVQAEFARTREEYEHLLEFENISLAFAGVTALDDVSFFVDDNELFAMIGP